MEERLVIDVETSGLDEYENEVLSLTLKVYGKDKFISHKIKPNLYKKIDKLALKVNNIDIFKLPEEGISKLDTIYSIITFIKRNFKGKPTVIGKNVHFDVNFIDQLFRQELKIRFKDYINYWYYDLSCIAGYLKNVGLIPDNIKLSNVELYKYYLGEDKYSNNVHDDYADVIMTEKVIERLEELKLRFIK